MMVASTIVPCRIRRPRSSSIVAHFAEQQLRLAHGSSSQWRKFSTVVASGTAASDRSMPAKPRNAWLS